jgi:hypothetical protein
VNFRLKADGTKEYLTEKDIRLQTSLQQKTFETSVPIKVTGSGGTSQDGSSKAEQSVRVYRYTTGTL